MSKKINLLSLCISNIYGLTDEIVKKEGQEVSSDRYYFSFKYDKNSNREDITLSGYYYKEKSTEMSSLLKDLNNNTTKAYKIYYIDGENLYKHESKGVFLFTNTYFYNIIRKKKYKFDNSNNINAVFKEKIIDTYHIAFQSLLESVNDGIIYNFKISNMNLSEILEIKYDCKKLTFSLKLKDKINECYLKTTKPEPKKPEPKPEPIKKNIKLKKLVNENIAPGAKNEFKDDIDINEISDKDDINVKILQDLKAKFTDINDADYELYSDESGKNKLEKIEFKSINDNDVIYVKIKQYFLTEDQKNAVDDLSKISLDDKNKNIYFIYELIDKINSNIAKIKDHQYCKSFINSYNNETNGLIKQYNGIIGLLVSQCNDIIGKDDNSGIKGIDETLEEDELNKLKEGQINKFKNLVGNYESKDISKYSELGTVNKNYEKALEDLDNKIKLFKEYKNYETTVENEVNTLLTNIKNKKVNEIDNFTTFKTEQESNFSDKAKKENLDNKYEKYKAKFEGFVNKLKGSFDNAITVKKNEFDRNSLKNKNSLDIFDEITKSLNDYKKSYSDINNIDDEKLKNTETIPNEINLKIDNILTKKLESIINDKKEIEKEIRDKFKAEDVNNIVKAILNIITNKKEELKIKITLTKKNTENLHEKYLTNFNNIIDKYKKGIYNNVKFSELRSEISENRNDINLYVDDKEVDYSQNITKDKIVSVLFTDNYIKKIVIPDNPKINGDEDNNDNEDNKNNNDIEEDNKNKINENNNNNTNEDTETTKDTERYSGTKKKENGNKKYSGK